MEAVMLHTSPNYRYVVIPGYLSENSEYCLERLGDIPGSEVFAGAAGGGVLRMSSNLPNRDYASLLDNEFPSLESSSIPGTEIGNNSAREVASRILPLQPLNVPQLAVAAGLAKRIRVPHIPVTLEHCRDVGERVVLLSGKSLRKLNSSDRGMALFRKTIEEFGMTASDFNRLDDQAVDRWAESLGSINHRPWWSMSVSGGLAEAEWHLAVLFYTAQLIAARFRPFYSVHLCDQIEGEPNFRRHWTSNR